MNEKELVWIVGPLRAGTTFLRLIMGMHPSVHAFGEFEEAVDVLGDEGFPSIADYRRHLSTHRAFQAKGLSASATETSYVGVVQDLYRQLGTRTERPFLCGSIHSRFDRLPEIWPNGRYVHLLRDPRDVARSCIGMGWVGNVYYGVDYWTSAEQRWDRLIQRIDRSRCHEVRYEELVVDPAGVLARLCAFLGVIYDPIMLDYPSHSTYGPPEPSLAQQWRKKLSPREVELVEVEAMPLMAARGYEPESRLRPPGALERAGLLVQNRSQRALFGIQRLGPLLWAKGRLGKLLPNSEFQRRTQLEINEVAKRHLR